MAVNRFVLNGISYHGHGAINEIPGIVKGKGIGIIVNNPEFYDVRSLEGLSPTKNRTVFTIADFEAMFRQLM